MTPVDVKETWEFDASKPFACRDGQLPSIKRVGTIFIEGYVGTEPMLWTTEDGLCFSIYPKRTRPLDLVNLPDDPAPIAGGERVSAEAMEWANSVADQVQNEIATTDPSTYTPLSEFKEKLREQIGATPLPTTGEGDEALWWFLKVLVSAGGSATANGDAHEAVNAFCDDREPTDTFNLAHNLKLVECSHNSLMDSSTVWITDAGRAYIAAHPRHPVPAPRHDGGTVDARFEIARTWSEKTGVGCPMCKHVGDQWVEPCGLHRQIHNLDEDLQIEREISSHVSVETTELRTLLSVDDEHSLAEAARCIIDELAELKALAAHPAQHDHAGGEDDALIEAAEIVEEMAKEWPADAERLQQAANRIRCHARKGARS